eukprot:CAMPEP_0184856044 /NCGR_PEP_ID=MMETSP0580-20130426/1203_1 /TAXON_ID=1118495 /ORGANISM="Dactyliosolen fragilissimus" /LENGTH=157 /DNA_ID=CAMNT_0027350813 /DNA_START=86 /DNA_END=559 /DNA_ORIENTATION=+
MRNTSTDNHQHRRNGMTTFEMAPGGWGIGTPNEMKDEEFSNPNKRARSRRRRRRPSSSEIEEVSFSGENSEKASGYELEDPRAFAQRVALERQSIKDAQRKELMNIAKMAGIGMQPKVNANPDEAGNGGGEKYGKYAQDFGTDENDLLDVRVEWDDE